MKERVRTKTERLVANLVDLRDEGVRVMIEEALFASAKRIRIETDQAIARVEAWPSIMSTLAKLAEFKIEHRPGCRWELTSRQSRPRGVAAWPSPCNCGVEWLETRLFELRKKLIDEG